MPTPEELEDKAAAEVVGPLEVALLLLAREAIAAAEVPGTDLLAYAERLRSLRLPADRVEAVRRQAGQAYAMGAEDGLPPRLSTEVDGALRRMPEAVREELDRAAVLMASGDHVSALAQARRAVTRTRDTAGWAVNRSLSVGTSDQAARLGAHRLWVPERDACLDCLAYAGLTAAPGVAFPGGLTYSTTRRPRVVRPVPDPPLHPNCRCRIVLWFPADGHDYPDALKREAQRSVLRGWSLPSESERSRVQAAGALLERVSLPRSVQDYAARAVRVGKFPKGRRFPTP